MEKATKKKELNKNSLSGMTVTDKNLTSNQIIDILKACKKAGVSEMKFGELSLSFGESHSKRHKKSPDTEISDESRKAMVAQSLELEEINSREDELAEMLLTDPVKYEALLMDGGLENAGQNTT